jgi:hypothetical protein
VDKIYRFGLFDNRIAHIARARGKVVARSQMLTPKLIPQFAKLAQHLRLQRLFKRWRKSLTDRFDDTETNRRMWPGAM